MEAWQLPSKQIGVDLGRKGLKDNEIVVLLRQHRNITFVTRDADFCLPVLRHPAYCLVMTNVGQNEVAAFVRRFLRHPEFDTQAKRMGKVVRASHAALVVWRPKAQSESHVEWTQTRFGGGRKT
jgi:hypothetical protein